MTDAKVFDLDAIVASGWAEPNDFPAAEWARAQAFWQARRAHDARLLATRTKASDLIREWTGREPRDVGSFGLRCNLETSDLDLAIGWPVDEREQLRSVIDRHAKFKGERFTSTSTTRLVYVFSVDEVEVDLSVQTEEDFAVACRMLDDIEATMTDPERIAHTWVKHLLRDTGRLEEYAAWKLTTYARFCPEFNWVPIPEAAS
ncbi:hypothetical protein [Nocardia terpenica]|uniref:Uncharacterized protein n=1 Tax=Nocardia terpenica TaxID=455432 RepID=A0A164LBM8_9NOCA|nr:hypothetical protein [Nocardia terpenica]KZM72229.1 hypothetical protein AWN90_36755 [Nocardia terpenica]NQE86625.1 hypothetical protein [Nocardia terpenica]